MATRALAATVAGVFEVSMTLDVTVPHMMTLPAPVVAESQTAKPTMVLELAVQAAKVSADEFVFEPDDAALMSEALMMRRA